MPRKNKEKELQELRVLMQAKEKERSRKEGADAAYRETLASGLKEKVKAIPQNLAEGTEDAITVIPHGASFGYADEALGMFSPELEERYKEAVHEARARSPVGTMIGEGAGMAGTTALLSGVPAIASKIPAALESGTLARAALEGALISRGESEGENIKDRTVDTVIGGGLSTATTLAGRLLKLPFKNAAAQKAKAYGAGSRDFQFAGKRADFESIVNDLEKAKFTDMKPRVFNPKTMQFEKIEGKSLNRNNFAEGLQERARETNATISDEVKDMLDSTGISVKFTDIKPKLEETKKKFLKRTTQARQLSKVWDDELDNASFMFTGADQGKLSLAELNEMKSIYQTEARSVYKNPAADEMAKSTAKIKADMASAIEDYIHDVAGDVGTRVRELNDVGFKMHIFRENIEDRIRADKMKSGRQPLPFVNSLKGLVGMQGGDPSANELLMKSKMGQVGQSIEPVRPYLEDFVKHFPTREFNRARGEGEPLSGPTMIKGGMDWVLPPDRAPQSLPEQLVRKPFPRTSQGVVENRDFILAKVAQQAPEMFDPIRDVIDFEPEKIPEVMPALMTAAPHLFEFDKFNRWDGKIYDPKAKELARKEIMGDDNMSNTEKALLMNRLNKTGEY